MGLMVRMENSMQTVQCHCGHSFETAIPEHVDLTANSADVQSILDGSFLTLVCPSCKESLRPERRVAFTWKESSFTWPPEPERWRFLHNAARYLDEEKIETPSVVFGYTELVERVSVLRDALDIFLVELVKLMLLAKVPDASRSEALAIRYHALRDGDLLFIVSGLPGSKAAELRFPRATWDGLVARRASLVEDEEYACMVVGPYISYSNVDVGDEAASPTAGPDGAKG